MGRPVTKFENMDRQSDSPKPRVRQFCSNRWIPNGKRESGVRIPKAGHCEKSESTKQQCNLCVRIVVFWVSRQLVSFATRRVGLDFWHQTGLIHAIFVEFCQLSIESSVRYNRFTRGVGGSERLLHNLFIRVDSLFYKGIQVLGWVGGSENPDFFIT